MDPRLFKSSDNSKTFFTPELIRMQLELLQKAEILRSSEVLLRFLEFVVEEALAGKAFEIKEYTIGINVFRRPASFKPQADAIVRINAGRLRRLLKQYYDGPGQNDPVRIDMPRGSYVPVFELVQKPQAEIAKEQQQMHRPTIAIVPFHNVGADERMGYFGDGFGEHLCSTLSHFQELTVIAYYSTRRLRDRDSDLRALGKYLGTQYLITGSYRFTPTHFRLNIQLVFTRDATQVWTETYEREWNDHNLFAMQDEITDRILSCIGSFNGAIIQHLAYMSKEARHQILGANDALYWFHYYKSNYNVDTLLLARVALEETLRINPHYSLGWAVYSEIYSDSYILDAQWVDNPLEQSRKYAEKSLQLNPTSQQGNLALAFASLLSRDKSGTITAGNKCIAINPHSSGHTGLAGAYLICAGKYEEGIALMNNSVATNQNYFWCLNVCFSLYHFHSQDYAKAYDHATLIKNSSTLFGPILQAASQGKLNYHESKATSRTPKLLNSGLEIEKKSFQTLQSIVLDKELIDDIMDGLHLAGFGVEPPMKKNNA